ncbi:MAG: hypothetical protein Ct9H300mP1_30300 [Planctomycetaceae bacterium]|nr:MAG: hypothetical protein Ct9H300mP1_30300 [Planctomycetaceae bacterium]
MADGQEVRTRVSSVMEDPSARAIARVYATARGLTRPHQPALAMCSTSWPLFLTTSSKRNPNFTRSLSAWLSVVTRRWP